MKNKENKQVQKNLKVLFKTSILVFVGILISKILSYGYRIIIAKHYGAEIYGVFSLALMIFGWFITFSSLGLADGLIRYISFYRGRKEEGKINYLFRTVLRISAISSIISGILLFILSDYIANSWFNNSELSTYLKIFSFLIPVSVISSLLLVTIKAFEKINWYILINNIFQSFAKLATLVILILIGVKSKAVPLSYVIGISCMLILAYFVCRYKIKEIFLKITLANVEKKKILKEFIPYSLPFVFFGIFSAIFYWIDSLSIGVLKGIVEVGLYNAAVPIALLLSVAPELFVQLFFPLITREYSKKNIALIKELTKQLAKWIFIINLPAFILLFLFPGTAINILFGSQYLAAENALRILIFGVAFSSVFGITSHIISMIGKSKLLLINIIIASIVNVILNYILIPMQKIGFIDNANGISGAAIATVISMVVLNILFVLQAYKNTKIVPIRRKMIAIFGAIIIPTFVLLYLKQLVSLTIINIIIISGLFLLLYVVFVLLFKGLDRNDLSIAKLIIRRFTKPS